MKVFVLIPTRNRKDLLIKCLDSLSEQTYPDIEIIVIDDGSTDGTKEILEKKKITVLEGNGNLWWSGAMRMGVDYVLSKSEVEDFVLIQNDDTYMERDFLKKLIKQSQENKRMLLGTPVFDYVSNKLIHDSHKIVHGSFRPVILNSKEEIIPADTLSGRGALIPIEVFRKIGNFSKVFPQYASDYDFFCRAKKQGFKIGVTTKTRTISTNSKPNLSQRVKKQTKLTLKDFFQLYFSRRSSNNLWSSTLITLMYSPWKYKIYGILRIYGVFIKTFFVNVLINVIK